MEERTDGRRDETGSTMGNSIRGEVSRGSSRGQTPWTDAAAVAENRTTWVSRAYRQILHRSGNDDDDDDDDNDKMTTTTMMMIMMFTMTMMVSL